MRSSLATRSCRPPNRTRDPGRLPRAAVGRPYSRRQWASQRNKVRAVALPLAQAGDHSNFLQNFRCGNPNYDPTQKETAKVSLWRMFSYSTVRERCLMVLGLVLSTFTGLGIPAWLVLLAQSLDVSVETRQVSAACSNVFTNQLVHHLSRPGRHFQTLGRKAASTGADGFLFQDPPENSVTTG